MGKNLPAMRERQVQSLGQGRSPREGNGHPLQYFCLENPMDLVVVDRFLIVMTPVLQSMGSRARGLQ